MSLPTFPKPFLDDLFDAYYDKVDSRDPAMALQEIDAALRAWPDNGLCENTLLDRRNKVTKLLASA